MFREQIELPVNRKAYNEGIYNFRGLQIACGEGVYIDKSDINVFFEPTLLAVKEKNNQLENLTMIDMGTGTGVLGIAMAIEVSNSIIYGVEKYEKAFYWAAKNAEVFKEQINKSNSKFIPVMSSAIDSINNLNKLHGQVDVIFTNYPSMPLPEDLSKLDILNNPYELTAIFGGEDGLDAIKEIIIASSIFLKKDGILITSTPTSMLEHVKPLFDKSVWNKIIDSPSQFMVAVKN